MLSTLVDYEPDTVIQKMCGSRKNSHGLNEEDGFKISEVLKKNKFHPLSNLEKLISQGMDINAVDEGLDENLLQYAARTGNLSLVKFLKHKGANIDDRNKRGENAYIIACRNGNFKIADFLLFSGSKLNSKNFLGMNALHIVTKEANHDCMCRLVERGINVNAQDKKGRTALHYATYLGDLETTVLLI